MNTFTAGIKVGTLKMYLLVRYYQVRRMDTNKQLSKLLNAVSIFNYDFAKTAGFYRFENMHVCVSV
jgi:hypothetical protein